MQHILRLFCTTRLSHRPFHHAVNRYLRCNSMNTTMCMGLLKLNKQPKLTKLTISFAKSNIGKESYRLRNEHIMILLKNNCLLNKSSLKLIIIYCFVWGNKKFIPKREFQMITKTFVNFLSFTCKKGNSIFKEKKSVTVAKSLKVILLVH